MDGDHIIEKNLGGAESSQEGRALWTLCVELRCEGLEATGAELDAGKRAVDES